MKGSSVLFTPAQETSVLLTVLLVGGRDLFRLLVGHGLLLLVVRRGRIAVIRRAGGDVAVPESRHLAAGRRALEDDVAVPGRGGRLRGRFRAVPRAVARGRLVGDGVLLRGGSRAVGVHTPRGVQPGVRVVVRLLPVRHQAVHAERGGGVQRLQGGGHVADDVVLLHDDGLVHAVTHFRVGFAFRFALQLGLGVLDYLVFSFRRQRLLLDLLPLQRLLLLPQRVFLLEASPTPQVRAVVEHVVRVGIQRPVTSLTRFLVVPGYFDEALVQAEVVPDGVLPTLLVFAVVRKPFHDELVDAVEGDLLVLRVLDGHRDQGYVRVRRLDHVFGRGELVLLVRPGRVSIPRVLFVSVRIRRGVPIVSVLVVAEERVHVSETERFVRNSPPAARTRLRGSLLQPAGDLSRRICFRWGRSFENSSPS